MEIKSVTNFWINCFSCVLFFTLFFYFRDSYKADDTLFLISCLLVAILPIIAYELYRARISKEDYLINFKHRNKFSLRRLILKFSGLAITYAFVFAVYRLFPIYKSDYYFQLYNKLNEIFYYLVALSIPYFIITDIFMRKPEDSYYNLGKFMLFRFSEIDRKMLWEHIKAWFVKIFFLPLMCIYSLGNFNFLHNLDLSTITNFKNVYDFLYTFIFTVDVIFAVLGYAMTLKLFNTQIYSAEPTFFGWFICLMCYEPFWVKVFNDNYFAYEDNYFWGNLFSINEIGYIIWGSLILCCITIYSLATVAFGIRFSNITYRGLVTNGPYTLTKHPAYVFKNISWWLISIPMLGVSDTETTIRNCAMLFGVNIVYYLRARTEENHLSNYPEYVAYAEMMNEKSIFAWVGKLLPFMKYSAEKCRSSESKVYAKFVGRTDLDGQNNIPEKPQVKIGKAKFGMRKK